MALVGNFQQDDGLSTRGRHFTSVQEGRLNGKLRVIIPHPGENTKTAQCAPKEMC